MYLKCIGAATLMLSLASSAFAAGNDTVAQIVALKGNVKVENAQGKRVNAAPNMQLTDGSTLIVLKGNVTVKYKSSACLQSSPANTLMSINAATQCDTTSQQLAMGQASAEDGESLIFGLTTEQAIAGGFAALGIGLIAADDNKSGSN